MLNRVVIVGRLTRDPDLRYTQSGIAVANFNVAANRPFKNAEGEQEADFINCVIWRKPAENLANYMKKGSLIGVDGRIQTSSYEGQDGKRVYTTEVLAESVQFLEPKNNNNNQSDNSNMQNGGYEKQTQQAQGNTLQDAGQEIDPGDDLPF